MVGPHAFWGSWRAAIGLTPAGVAIIEGALGVIDARLARYGSGPDRFGLVHADLHLANLLVHDTNLRIIDFDDCGFSWFMYDFATAVSFIEHQPNVPDLLSAWTAGYRTRSDPDRGRYRRDSDLCRATPHSAVGVVCLTQRSTLGAADGRRVYRRHSRSCRTVAIGEIPALVAPDRHRGSNHVLIASKAAASSSRAPAAASVAALRAGLAQSGAVC